MKLLSFDIEISDLFELQPYEDMAKYAPFHISVAATAIDGGEERIWYSRDRDGRPELNLSQEQALELLTYLADKQDEGYAVCAWNGLGFDLQWIGHQAEDFRLAANVALRSYDPMFQFFCAAGFPVALAKVAQAMGIHQTKLLDGADAPREWCGGNHKLVMDYCLGDCQMTNQVIRAIVKAKAVHWITARGTPGTKPMLRLRPVEDIIPEPGPDQSWMDSPIPKERFYSWIQELGVI
jgi:RNase_H superfamily